MERSTKSFQNLELNKQGVASRTERQSVDEETLSVSKKREDQEDATIRCLLLTSVPTCFGHHYANLEENKGPVTAFGVLF